MAVLAIPALPSKILASILKTSDDWKLCLKLEAINANLPNLYPDAGIALDATDLLHFPASSFLVQRSTETDEDELDLLEVAFLLKFPRLADPENIVAWNLHSLKIIRYLHGRTDSKRFFDIKFDGILTVMDVAAQQGCLDILTFLHENRQEGCTTYSIQEAAANGHFKVVKYLHEKVKPKWTKDTLVGAACYGRFDIIKLLLEDAKNMEGAENMDLSKIVVQAAMFTRHLEIIKYFHTVLEGNWPASVMDRAASCGHLDIVKFLNENGQDGCTNVAMDLASSRGFLDVVKYLHSNTSGGCTTVAMDTAAAAGNIDVLKFLHENRSEGCTAAALERAAKNGHLGVVVFLVEDRKEPISETAITNALESGHGSTVPRRLGPPVNPLEAV
ncbi:hypothetical protein HDU97_000924 [Phlyctochytrium planicorne]|nr:hypothetical protein HDU97_000924 [Phlyctochytrium planicorne]